jgi:hypothetical protein
VFVHLVAATDDRPLAQSDGLPDAGRRPTADWVVGEYVADRHDVAVPATLPPGEYRVVVGLYQAESGRRAEVVSESARAQAVELGTVRVAQL